MAGNAADLLEMRVSHEFKDRLHRAADRRGVSITRFALEALEQAVNEVLESATPAPRTLGWATGTARDTRDIETPAASSDEWSALAE
jgi:hypothetical protein